MFSKFLEMQLATLLGRKEEKLQVTFATSCWEKDWKRVLDPSFLQKKIENHTFSFSKKILIINNVKNPQEVFKKALEAKIFTEIYFADEYANRAFHFFCLERKSFKVGLDKDKYVGVNDDWIYYNALAPLSAIYLTDTPYLLYCTGDVYLEERADWIPKALKKMQKKKIKVANLTWNDKYAEAKRESYKETEDFYVAKEGFSDQLFLIKTKDFQKPIYSEIRKDAEHYPRGDVFEKRVYSYMKTRGWKRITYKKASYTHEEKDV